MATELLASISFVFSLLALIASMAAAITALSIKWSTHKTHLIPMDPHIEQIEKEAPEEQSVNGVQEDLDRMFMDMLKTDEQL